MKKLLLGLIIAFGFVNVYSQCSITAFANVDTLNCGDSVIIGFNAFANSALQENFTALGPSDPGWLATSGAQYDNPYISSPTNDTYFWMGSSAAVPTTLQTIGFDVLGGGQICFDFVYAVQGGGPSIEGPDLSDEGISLQYSTDGGTTWIDIVYFMPDGQTLPSNPGSGYMPFTTVTSAGTPFTTWNSVCFPLPLGAQTSSTSFQWIQENNSGACCDHWGLDNIQILVADTTFEIHSINDGVNLGQAPATYIATPISDSTFNFLYTNEIDDTCYASYSIIMNPTDLGPDILLDCNQNIVQLNALGVSLNDNFFWTPTTTMSDSTILNPMVSPLDTIDYIFTSSCGIDTVTVNVVSNYYFSTSADTTICVGDSAFLEVFGGAQSYTWTPNDGSISDTSIANPIFTPTQTTTYTVVTDSAGCIKTNDITVRVSNKVFSILLITDASCSGINDGSLIVVGSGSIDSSYYSLDDGTTVISQSGIVFNNLYGGNYLLTYYDDYNCPVDTNIIIPGGISINIDSIQYNNPLCAGANNGSIEVFVDTNVVVDYSLNGGPIQNSPIFNNLTDGTYLVSAQVGTCPLDTQTVVLFSPATVQINFVDSTDLTCGGASDGIIQVSASSGVSPYQYSIDNITFAPSAIISSLPAGPYTIYVMDDNGCKDSLITSISEPLPLVINNINIVNSLCYGDSGSISFDVLNGASPYQYSVDSTTFVGSNSFTNLPYGTYYLQAQDDNGCFSSVVIDSVLQPTPLVLVLDSTQSSTCGASDGIVYVSAFGGSSGYLYSINGGATQISGTFTGLTSGVHNVVVTDTNGCDTAINVTVSDFGAPVLTIIFADSVSCNGASDASVQLSATGGVLPYQYSINGGLLNSDSLFTFVSSGLNSFIVEDDIGCQGTIDTVIFEPIALSITASQDSTSCYGTADGEINILASGGTSPYYYAIDNILITQLSPNFSAYNAGTYMNYVLDTNGCIDSVSQEVFEADSLIINNITVTDVNCFNAADGTISFDGLGGIPIYEYSIDGGSTFVNTNSFTVDTGTYSLIIRDSESCLSEGYFETITQADSLILDSLNSISTNCGLANGTLEVLASGGTVGYQYSLNGGANQSSGLFTNVSSMTHNLIVTDGNNCTNSISIIIDSIPNLTLTIVNFDSISCNGLSDASVTVQASGGQMPYMYSVNGGVSQSSPVFTNLNGGLNYFEVIDVIANCTGNDTIDVFEPMALNLTASQDSVNCFAYSDGQINVFATGGTYPYSYALNDVSIIQTDSFFNALNAGNYTAYVVDENGCIDSVAQEVFQADTLEILNTVAVDISCSADGSITVNGSGGTMPYAYSINGGATQISNVFVVSTEGTYSLQLYDANSCPIASAIDSVTAPDPVTFIVDSLIDSTSCYGLSDAYISILANGGTAPYTYSFNNGSTYSSTNILNTTAGNYTLIVQDVFGCESTTTDVVIYEPNALNSTSSSTSIVCNGESNGTIIINSVLGGTSPYFVNIGASDFSYSPNLLFDNLSAGSYTITLTDVNNCNYSYLETVGDVSPVNISLNSYEDVSCFGANDGEIHISTSGGTPIYNYQVYTPTSTVSATGESVSFTNLEGSELGVNYLIVVSDANACQDSLSQVIIQPNQLLIDSIVTTPLSCFGAEDASLVAFVSGGSIPYQYNWSPTSDTDNEVTGVSPGIHTVNVTDANNCTTSLSATIAGVDPIIATINPDSAFISMGDTLQLSVNVENAIGSSLQYSWSPIEGLSCTDCENPFVTVYNDIEYSVVVTDENGCENYNVNGTYVIVDRTLFFFVPSGFSPNGDGINDVFEVYGQDIKSVSMIVFNRWGEKVFEGNNQFNTWSGTFKGVIQNAGIYTYSLAITFLNDASVSKKGSVTLIR